MFSAKGLGRKGMAVVEVADYRNGTVVRVEGMWRRRDRAGCLFNCHPAHENGGMSGVSGLS